MFPLGEWEIVGISWESIGVYIFLVGDNHLNMSNKHIQVHFITRKCGNQEVPSGLAMIVLGGSLQPGSHCSTVAPGDEQCFVPHRHLHAPWHRAFGRNLGKFKGLGDRISSFMLHIP